MKPDFWFDEWESGKRGWRQSEANNWLQAWFTKLSLAPGSRVLVPLCGDSIDMSWLSAQGMRVVGVELSESAITQYQEQHSLTFERTEQDGYIRYSNEQYDFLVGDYFNVTSQLLGQVDAVYDRAALIALPPDMRARYVEKTATLLNADTQILLVNMTYDPSKMNGPPFTIETDEIQALFDPHYDIAELERSDDPALLGGLVKRGLDAMTETVYLMTRR